MYSIRRHIRDAEVFKSAEILGPPKSSCHPCGHVSCRVQCSGFLITAVAPFGPTTVDHDGSGRVCGDGLRLRFLPRFVNCVAGLRYPPLLVCLFGVLCWIGGLYFCCMKYHASCPNAVISSREAALSHSVHFLCHTLPAGGGCTNGVSPVDAQNTWQAMAWVGPLRAGCPHHSHGESMTTAECRDINSSQGIILKKSRQMMSRSCAHSFDTTALYIVFHPTSDSASFRGVLANSDFSAISYCAFGDPAMSVVICLPSAVTIALPSSLNFCGRCVLSATYRAHVAPAAWMVARIAIAPRPPCSCGSERSSSARPQYHPFAEVAPPSQRRCVHSIC